MGPIDLVNGIAGAVVSSTNPPGSNQINTALSNAFGGSVPKEIDDLFKKIGESGFSPQELWNQFSKGLQVILSLFGVTLGGGVPGFDAPAFDAQQALQKVAEAINAAESTLRQSQFAIVGGTADLEMKIKLLGDDGPSAKLNLQIAPRPHP